MYAPQERDLREYIRDIPVRSIIKLLTQPPNGLTLNVIVRMSYEDARRCLTAPYVVLVSGIRQCIGFPNWVSDPATMSRFYRDKELEIFSRFEKAEAEAILDVFNGN